MTQYKAKQVVEIGAETVVQLTEDQAKTRLHNLQSLGEGRYRAVKPIQFKRGEVFGMDGSLPRGHEHYVESVNGQALDAAPPIAGAPAEAPAADGDPVEGTKKGTKKGFFRK